LREGGGGIPELRSVISQVNMLGQYSSGGGGGGGDCGVGEGGVITVRQKKGF